MIMPTEIYIFFYEAPAFTPDKGATQQQQYFKTAVTPVNKYVNKCVSRLKCGTLEDIAAVTELLGIFFS